MGEKPFTVLKENENQKEVLMKDLIHALTGRVACTVIISKTIQEQDYEPYAVEVHETRWVKEEEYEQAHMKMFKRLDNRMMAIIKENFPSYYK